MADALRRPWASLDPIFEHFRREKWTYVFGAFIWALVWYGSMVLMSFIQGEDLSGFPVDVMPLIAGVPIIVVGWRGVALGGRLEDALHDFDDGAAFSFPSNKPGVLKDFLADFRRSIKWWSRIISVAIALISLAGVIALASWQGEDIIHQLLAVMLVIGVPLIAWPIGNLLGQLMGFGRLNRIMTRHGIGLAGVSTPQARDALLVLEQVRIFAAIAPLIMCYWFAGWWIAWSLGVAGDYAELWKTQFFILWMVSIVLFIFVGIIPAHGFKQMVLGLSGGEEGRAARQEQIDQAEKDLEQWQQSSASRSRHQRQRIAELEFFIRNLKEQKIESRLLNVKLLLALLIVNLLILVGPVAVSVLLESWNNPIFQGTKA
ncbi:hypothetical protein IE4771_PE00092 (plasmid) [Rhizobium etli bv. mimosae str. IE4771]|uniref:Uncharacterized protein n=1 Tax=Rhizobium etli bv. mimosae str. IE4771 TaxID=1432050 RepID=A0A060I8M7_RHIET|nr:hypothetical protein [Rhizobium sp. IE4771]AIC31318.1 hypothetical protein IE4771_PE00092 [Rhizobium sp. IE4771]